MVKKNFPNRPIGCTHRFKNTNHICSFENEYQQSRNHVEARHCKHQKKDDPYIHIQQIEPAKNLRVHLFYGLREISASIRIDMISGNRMNCISCFVQLVEVVNQNFEAAVLLLIPVIQFFYMAYIGEDK